MILARRTFLAGLSAGFVCAPAIITASHLMRIVRVPPAPLRAGFQAMAGERIVRENGEPVCIIAEDMPFDGVVHTHYFKDWQGRQAPVFGEVLSITDRDWIDGVLGVHIEGRGWSRYFPGASDGLVSNRVFARHDMPRQMRTDASGYDHDAVARGMRSNQARQSGCADGLLGQT